MAPKETSRLQHAWNAFTNRRDPKEETFIGFGENMTVRPDRVRKSFGNERSIINSIYTRISVDMAQIDIRHVRLDENDRYLETINSGLNSCLNLEANIDQASRLFKQTIAYSLCDRGVIALVPIDTSLNPMVTGSYDINSMRIAEIVAWYPRHVRVSVYNDNDGKYVEMVLEKAFVAIIENPFYEIMNQPNSTLQRLIRKLSILDSVDEAAGSGKLDLIIQLPYVIKSDARRKQAEQRRSDIEVQLKGSKYGIAYTDGTERITQLNRPAENNLLGQIEYLTNQLYAQLGLTPEVFNGTASDEVMLNYFNRTLEPMLAAITQAMKRRFLTKTGRSQGQSIEYFRDPFEFISVKSLGDVAEKLTRNEIASANEIRSVLGWKPHTDPQADQLVNSNMPADKRRSVALPGTEPQAAPDNSAEQDQIMDDTFAQIEKSIDDFTSGGEEAA